MSSSSASSPASLSAHATSSASRHKVVVWDRVGNVTWGVRPWHEWDLRAQAQLLRENPAGRAAAPSLEELFTGYDMAFVFAKSLDDVATELPDADFLVVHKHTVPPAVLQRGEKLRLIQHLGQDYRGIPVATAQEMGVPVAATPLVNYLVVAEHVWALMLTLLKQIPAQRRYMAEREYLTLGWGIYPGTPGVQIVRDLTLGLLGFGEIARPLARMTQAFDMPCIYWDIVRFPELEAKYNVRYVEWDEIFAQSDVLSVQLALNEQTEGIIGPREFGLMKHTAYFINTARGKLVDQAALTDALRHRRLAGAGLDVFDPEPLPADDPLHDLAADPRYNVTLTAHTAWQGHWTHIRDSLEIWHNILRVLRGEPVRHLVSD